MNLGRIFSTFFGGIWKLTLFNEVSFTYRAEEMMKIHHMSEEDCLWVLNYPDREEKLSADKNDYSYEKSRDWGPVRYNIRCVWSARDKSWLVTTCWKSKSRKRY